MACRVGKFYDSNLQSVIENNSKNLIDGAESNYALCIN